MPGIGSSIFEHTIKMYPEVKPIRQCLRPVHPKKAADIKVEVENFLRVGFVYPVLLID